MIEAIKRVKFSYALYNFFHKKELVHNEKIYQQLGLNKKYYSPISSKDFEKITAAQQQKLTQPKALKSFADCELYHQISEESKNSLADFDANGFAIIRNYLTPETVTSINNEIETLLANKTIKFRYGNKLMFVIHHSKDLQNIATDPKLLELLGACIEGNPVLFQSINFISGSEQATHSDSIHMTTFPLGGLLGVWIALDDIEDDNGPLHYYPGSHKLPYYLNKDYDNEGSKCLIGDKTYDKYEAMIADKIKDLNLPKQKFYAKKGDLLIWHANLFHGGDKHINKNKTRRSIVFHYFREHSVCYHEITQRPALLKNFD